MKKERTWMVALGLGVVFALTGCSRFSGSRWAESVREPVPAQDITGAWEGTWRSEKNGHHGRLRCWVTSETPAIYRFHYHATFWKVFRGSYVVTQTVERVGQTLTLSGGADLGKLWGGHYSYEGTATPAAIRSTYRAKVDHGVFELRRPTPR